MLVVYQDFFASLFVPSAEAQGIAVCSDPKQMNSAPDEQKKHEQSYKSSVQTRDRKKPAFCR